MSQAVISISWYFDFISPFAYLQWETAKRMHDRVAFKPILFAGLLKHWGHLGPAEIPAKRVFTYRHVTWLAKQKGLKFRFPSGHPFNPLFGLRLCVAANQTLEAVDRIFSFVWKEGNTFSDSEKNRQLAAEVGISDPGRFLSQPEIKMTLRANGEQAIAHGVFGVPTFVADGEIFWGNDATGMLINFLENRRLFEAREMKRVSNLPVESGRN